MIKPNGSPAAKAPKAVRKPVAPPDPLKSIPLAARLEGAREVFVGGDFTDWAASAVRLLKASDGLWTVTLRLPPGEYQYRLLVDGQWRDHTEAPRRVPNPFGTENCVLTVS